MNKASCLLKVSLLIICFIVTQSTFGLGKTNGYKIEVHVSNCQDTTVQLCNYYGKAGMVNIVSTKTIKKSNDVTFTFENDTAIVGGIYLIMFKNKRSQFEFILNNGAHLQLNYNFDKPVETASIIGSEESKQYLAYFQFLTPFNDRHMLIQKEMALAKTAKDSSVCNDKVKALSDEIRQYRKMCIKKFPSTFMATYFTALEFTDMPKKIENNNEQRDEFIKKHIWEFYDFTDDRLAFTPINEGKLETYLSLTTPVADSIKLAMDLLLKKMEKSKELYKFTLDWMLRAQENAKVLFADDCFIYLVENYYLKGKATWVTDSFLTSYKAKISNLATNVIGVKAPEINIFDIKDQASSLQSIYTKHDYTAIIFWSPTCSHCKEEIPKLDSAFASLHRDIVIVGIDAFRETEEWRKLVNESHYLNTWFHLYDAKQTSDYRKKYAVYSSPIVYLVDRNGIIVGKRFTHSNLNTLFDFLDKEKNKNKK